MRTFDSNVDLKSNFIVEIIFFCKIKIKLIFIKRTTENETGPTGNDVHPNRDFSNRDFPSKDLEEAYEVVTMKPEQDVVITEAIQNQSGNLNIIDAHGGGGGGGFEKLSHKNAIKQEKSGPPTH